MAGVSHCNNADYSNNVLMYTVVNIYITVDKKSVFTFPHIYTQQFQLLTKESLLICFLRCQSKSSRFTSEASISSKLILSKSNSRSSSKAS